MQTVKLNLSNGKTYETEIKELSVGTVKKVIKSIDWEKVMKDSKTDEDFAGKVIASVLGGFDIFEQILCDVFKGLTIEELEEYGTPSEIANALSEIFTYTAFKISSIGAGLKNLIREGAGT